MDWGNTWFGHITIFLELYFWCAVSLRVPTAESLIKRDLPVKCIASHEILIPRRLSLWPRNYQEDQSRQKVREKLLSLEGSSCLELLRSNVACLQRQKWVYFLKCMCSRVFSHSMYVISFLSLVLWTEADPTQLQKRRE